MLVKCDLLSDLLTEIIVITQAKPNPQLSQIRLWLELGNALETTMINDIKVKKLTIMSYFQQTCQSFDKDVKKMTLFIAEIPQKSEKICLLLGNSS